VQTEDFVMEDEMFSPDYAYFSSYSTSWLKHAKKYTSQMIDILDLNDSSMVVDVAANDGYLLQYFQEKKIPCYGIEPTKSTAEVAIKKGIKVIQDFFGCSLARQLSEKGHKADLMAANNVLAHVPDINDFVKGFSILLKPNGVATFENPHLVNLVEQNQFDTIYHEHFSYLSLTSVKDIFLSNGLEVYDVEEMPSHGGSLRYYAQRKDTGKRKISKRVELMIKRESVLGVNSLPYYDNFQTKVEMIKDDFLSFLIKAKKDKKLVVAYGAAAKGNTLLNFSGVKSDLIKYVVDLNPAKVGKFMPGSRIPIVNECALREDKPDFIFIFPWNLKREIMDQLNYARSWKVKFVVAVPKLTVY
jgi:SAM-dependent methyltransferase